MGAHADRAPARPQRRHPHHRGLVLVSVLSIECGGHVMTRVARGQVPMTEFGKSFARAGHAHAQPNRAIRVR